MIASLWGNGKVMFCKFVSYKLLKQMECVKYLFLCELMLPFYRKVIMNIKKSNRAKVLNEFTWVLESKHTNI